MTTKQKWTSPTLAEHHFARSIDNLRIERRRIECEFGQNIGRYAATLNPNEYGTIALYLMQEDRALLSKIGWLYERELWYRSAWQTHFYRRRPDLKH